MARTRRNPLIGGYDPEFIVRMERGLVDIPIHEDFRGEIWGAGKKVCKRRASKRRRREEKPTHNGRYWE